jgi:UDP-N-acetylglucosamine--N-acetylmuramyl-(pentapeptide) pyrophosphoryl-undecaprenol N-acetylglucosamine transferase
LVLSRSGASTVAELAAAGKPSLLIPFPHAADDHQRKNAEALAEAGAAIVFLEAGLTPENLLQTLTRLLTDRQSLEQMSAQARVLAHPDATSRIAAMAIEVAR